MFREVKIKEIRALGINIAEWMIKRVFLNKLAESPLKQNQPYWRIKHVWVLFLTLQNRELHAG